VKTLCPIFVGLLLVCPLHAQRDLQSLTIPLSATASDAAVAISVWDNVAEPPQGLKHPEALVVGTGFLINRNGDFITAGHVIDSLNSYKGNPKITDARLTARIRQRDGSGGDRQFTITDRDDDHDLVLGHVPGVNAVTPEKSRMPKNISPLAAQRFASLAISRVEPKTGQFVLVSGFPLGSWTPTVQLGMVAATSTLYPSGITSPAIRKDRGDLLQISVDANHGNSGGPVIDLESGRVIGVLDALVPAPLQLGQQIYNQSTFSASGIMLAIPAKWVEALLEKNHIKSEGVAAGKFVAW
jgi:S1-C subfamily serine protease